MRKILLVDNDITFIWGLKKYLQRRSYAVETAATLAEAREMIKQEAPLLICSDLCLPDGSGLELLAEVRTCNKDTPFIIASCYEKTTMSRKHSSMVSQSVWIKLNLHY